MTKKPVSRAPKAPTPSSSARGDWRHETLDRVRTLIHEADPEAIEEAKWPKATNPAGVPTWSHDGILCTGEIYKDKIKLTFMQGSALKDPSRLFNAGLEGGTRRGIDIHDGDRLNDKAFVALIREAVALNTARTPAKEKRT